jgi:hypothetical protein
MRKPLQPPDPDAQLDALAVYRESRSVAITQQSSRTPATPERRGSGDLLRNDSVETRSPVAISDGIET